MHPNPIFHTKDARQNLEFAAARAFGMLSVSGAEAPLLAHVPFLLEDDYVWLHLVRSNPIARALVQPLPACLAVVGPDSYVSPDWYGVEDQVPTWNYVAVHLRGPLERLPDDALRDILDRESALFEEQLKPKLPWVADKMSAGVMEKMMRQIVPCRMRIDDVAGTWKLSQNKPHEVRMRAADGVEATGLGAGLAELAAMMRNT